MLGDEGNIRVWGDIRVLGGHQGVDGNISVFGGDIRVLGKTRHQGDEGTSG